MVTFVQRLRQLVAGKEQPKPKAAASSGTRPDYFRKSTRDKNTLARNAAIYESGGLVTAAIKAPGRTVLSNGWRLDGEEGAVKQVQAAIDALDFETLVSMLVDYAYVHGNGLAEIVPLRGGGLTVQLRDPARFRIEQDAWGNIVGYRFVQEDSWDDSHGPLLLPEEMIDLNLDPVPNSPYGRSLVSVCIDEILRDAKTNEGLAKAIERHGFPKYHIGVGVSGEQVAEADLKGLRKEFENLSSKNEFITGPDIAINTIDATGIDNSSEIDNVFSARLCASLGVPPEQIGLDATGSTEATANVRFRAWYDRVAALQRVVATTLSRQLFDRITGRPGACWIVFEDPSPEDMAKKAEWIAKIMAATPMDPFAVLPQDWIQEQFGIDPTMLEEYTPPDETERENAAPDPETVVEEADADLATIARETEQKILAALGARMTLPKVTIKGGPSPATTFIELDGAKMQCVVSGRYILSPDPDGLNVLQLGLAAEIEEITHEGPIIISLGDGKRYLLRDIEELPGTVEGEELGKHVVRYFKRVSEAGEIA